MSTFFSQNLRFLRSKMSEKTSQEKLAELIKIKKPTLGSYESGRAEPKYADLIDIAEFFKVEVDELLKEDLSKRLPGMANKPKLRILATTVDSNNEENIEMVPVKALAGYTASYDDVEFIQELPTFQVPFLPRDKKYRVFPIKGESMLPLQPGSLVFAEYVEDWNAIKDGTICIVVTREDGVVLKQVINHLADRKVLILNSTNKTYDPYPILGAEIQEIWKFAGYFHSDFPITE
ncbi:XRE family transcriptional regulator [Aquirufa regiilacus]|jgi:transcriptional regulator with XRE-family HTH domain|uniref:Helix-turn-helix domain-containing protein n=1 Tax=Aquirufa regiilacus TaxID=3024868 RepID=A0ABU3TRQ8_9BACT|nr:MULTISPECIES: helix-turn-helix domain-containing protein [unclassified Aquirufa]MDT8888124.1 helix-turn-helix domain-containing protein [Aquirufa sp. LEPPI-3A]MDU0808534.1 helix-turn-helix domain-containing protein [Aquirufa sp. LEOWEIH-7C]